jgi:hypothetical protein
MKVGLLTIEQKELIEGKEYAKDSFFNPIQDNSNNWVISTEEMQQAQDPYKWIKELPLIDYEPKPSPPFPNKIA